MATASDARVQSAAPVDPTPSTNVSAPTATPNATVAFKTATKNYLEFNST